MNNSRNNEFIKSFGKKLRKIRLKKGIAQEKLANDADIPIQQIGRIERGEINTTVSTAFAIANALEIPLKRLFDFEVKK